FDDDGFPFHIPVLPQALGERRGEMRRGRRSTWMEDADPGDFRGLLRPGGDRDSEEATRQGDEKPEHSSESLLSGPGQHQSLKAPVPAWIWRACRHAE